MVDYFTIVGIILIIILAVLLRKKYRKLTTDQKLQQIKDKVIMIDPRVERLNFYVDFEEAYILYKKDIFMCLKNKAGDYYDDNFLSYIAIHEIAHALSPGDTSEHPPSFEKEFDNLINKAIALKIYDPKIPFPTEYCNKELKYY